MKKPMVSAIAAIGKGRVLGKGNKLLWHIPDDLKRFKKLTKGHPVIMGRKTFESILEYTGKPLPERTNIVVTRDVAWQHEGAIAAQSIEDAVEKGKGLDADELFIIGGAQIYEQALPYSDKLYLTLIDAEAEADSFFPSYETEFTKKVFEEKREWNDIKYRWVDLER
jgi:dihydrofolate reductase